MQADSTAAIDTTTVAPVSVGDAAAGFVTTLESWVTKLGALLPKLVVAAVVVIAAVYLARVVRRIVEGVLHRTTGHAPQAKNVVGLLATLAYAVVLAAGAFVALRIVGLDGIVTTLLAGAGIVGLALGFAFQDIAANFIAGVLMAVRNPFVVGEIIETNGYTGPVREINLRSTVLDTFQGQKVILPNAKVFGDPIINFSTRGERRVDLTCGVGYGDDLAHAQRVAVEAIEGMDERKESKPVQLYFTEFGDSSINFVVRFWVDFQAQTDFLEAQSRAIMAVKTAFDGAGVTIPFPIRTLDFDPNGGVDLRRALKGSGGESAEPASGDDWA